MERYCILLVDRSGHVLGVDEIEAQTEQQAVERARKTYVCGDGNGFEIWQDSRRLYAHIESRLSYR